MPMRSNMFNEQIAQPDTSFDEILQARMDYGGIDLIKIESADIFAESDDNFLFGGTLFGRESVALEDEQFNENDFREFTMEFDGFGSVDEAREWLLSIGLKSYQINETVF